MRISADQDDPDYLDTVSWRFHVTVDGEAVAFPVSADTHTGEVVAQLRDGEGNPVRTDDGMSVATRVLHGDVRLYLELTRCVLAALDGVLVVTEPEAVRRLYPPEPPT